MLITGTAVHHSGRSTTTVGATTRMRQPAGAPDSKEACLDVRCMVPSADLCPLPIARSHHVAMGLFGGRGLGLHLSTHGREHCGINGIGTRM
jgi:hypothetical protein